MDKDKPLTEVFAKKQQAAGKGGDSCCVAACCPSMVGSQSASDTGAGTSGQQRVATGISGVVKPEPSGGLGLARPDAPMPEAPNRKALHLSAGQRELVAVARALVRRRPVLLLDEAAAAADATSADLVHQAVMRGGATVITICHRLQHIGDFDAVVVMDQGRVVEAGPPADLLANEASWLSGLVGEWRRAEQKRQESEGTLSSGGGTPIVGGGTPIVGGGGAAGAM